MKKYILFDLDSTLLQMNQDEFLNDYYKLITMRIMNAKMDPKVFFKFFMQAVHCVINSNGEKLNKDIFWEEIENSGYDVKLLDELFSDFYQKEFTGLKSHVKKTSTPKLIVDYLNSKGYTLILATNPLFPYVATYERMSWAGLKPDDFALVTTYDNSHYCKPNKNYYKEIMAKLNANEDECVMIGNDIDDDFLFLPEGIDSYYITDYGINKNNKNITIPKFSLDEFYSYLRENF